MGAEVDKRIYRNMDHTINRDEIGAVQQLLDRVLTRAELPGPSSQRTSA
jgi:hypothetical protein